jgi:molecular chaperone GrpE
MKLAKLFDLLEKELPEIAAQRIKLFGEGSALPDFANLQAHTAAEYQEWKDDIEKFGKIIETSEQAGAETAFVELASSIATPDGELKFVQLSEPLANKIYNKYGLAYVGYAAADFSKLFQTAQDNRVNLQNPYKQGDIDIVELKADELNLVFRSRSLSAEVTERNKPITESEMIERLQSEISNLRKQMAELEKEKEAKLEIMADFQNYRKRMEKEKASFGLMTNVQIVNDVLDVLDDVKRVIEDDQKDINRCQQMFTIVKDKLLATIESVGIDMIEVKQGDAFDSSKMEAVGTITVASIDDHNKVVGVIQPAYKYADKDQMLRMAKVIVGKKDTKKN